MAAHVRDADGAPPHPFAVANVAWCGVRRAERQSVLVSGESGAISHASPVGPASDGGSNSTQTRNGAPSTCE